MTGARAATLAKAGPTGASLGSVNLDTSSAGLNIVQFTGWVASMRTASTARRAGVSSTSFRPSAPVSGSCTTTV